MKKCILLFFFSFFITVSWAQKRIYVGNVHPETTKKEMISLFSEFGTVQSVTFSETNPKGVGHPESAGKTKTDGRHSATIPGVGKLYAIVEMSDKTDVNTVIKTLETRSFKGRKLTFETPVFRGK
jgi:RNA recognition motif-containing protein